MLDRQTDRQTDREAQLIPNPLLIYRPENVNYEKYKAYKPSSNTLGGMNIEINSLNRINQTCAITNLPIYPLKINND